jgi:hypothetical protein
LKKKLLIIIALTIPILIFIIGNSVIGNENLN